MSIAVTMNLGLYALIATDTRVVVRKPGEAEVILFTYDQHQKVYKTGLGMITGLGYAPLLGAVHRRVAQTTFSTTNTTDDILAIINSERQRYLDSRLVDEFTRESVEKNTYFVLTYKIRQADGTPALRLVCQHPEWSAGFNFFETYVCCPFGTTTEQYDKANKFLYEHRRPLADGTDQSAFDANVAYHVRMAAEIIYEFADVNKNVSPEFQVGIHGPFGVKISEICRDGKTVVFPAPEQAATESA